MSSFVKPRGSRRKFAAEINVVPYIDVMLVLLVIFMVTAPLLTQGIDVDLPQTNAATIPNPEEPVTLYVDARGHYFLDVGTNKDQPLSDEDLVHHVKAVLLNKPQTMILVKADKKVPYEAVARGMTLLQAGGASKMGFVTDPLPPSVSGNKSRGG
jgi:biopolymer transport protein TolR